MRGGGALVVVDDYIVNGAPIGFTAGSLAVYLSAFFTALCEAYHKVIPPTLFAGSDDRMAAVGVSSLEFNRRRLSEYLLHKAFIAALDKAEINRGTVDAQVALTRARRILADIDKRYPDFFSREILPLVRDRNLPEGEVAAEAAPLLDAEIGALESDLTAFLDDESLSLPEKEAVMAMILGRDNPRLRGVGYDENTMLLDDAGRVPVNLYVDTFNELAEGSGILPVRGDFPKLRRYETDPLTGQRVESPENRRAFDPLPDIKRLKRQILDTTAFIRKKTDELHELIEADRTRRTVEEDKRGHEGFGDRPVQAEIKEQPLDEVYVPSGSGRHMESVDLRPFFSPARSQGKLGSCTTFAVVSMYEAIMNRFAAEGAERANLSERFVYYYSNVLKGKPEGGSNYYDQLAVLGQQGICREELFGYTTENLGEAPSEEAVEEAKGHRVLKALQIPLCDKGTEEEKMRENHRLLTSALAEGYPVGIALRLYDNFGDNGPYINRPDEKDKATGPTENHAMVLVGYSESEKCYIVRNSWGDYFGDNGYCYISAAYIDDPGYNFFACVIAETTESKRGKGSQVQPVTSPFAGTETQINIAAIRNVLDEAYVILRSRQELYNENYRYYRALMQQLCMPQARTRLRQAAEEKSAEVLIDIAGRRSRLEESFVGELKAFRRNYIKWALALTGVTLFYVLVAVILTCYGLHDMNTPSWWIAGGLQTALTVFVWLNYKWAVRKRRRELNDRLADLAQAEANARRDLLEKQIRFHVAGMWLDRLHDLSIGLDKVYNRLVSYNDHLKAWYAEDSSEAASLAPPEGSMFISLGRAELLDRFFDSNRDLIAGKIDLMETFRGYSVDSETIEAARRRISEEVMKVIASLLEPFRLSDFLLGQASYPYLDPLPLEETLAGMLRLGQPSSRHVTTGLSSPMRLLLMKVPPSQAPAWQERVAPCFPFVPLTVDTLRPDSLILLTVQPLGPASLR